MIENKRKPYGIWKVGDTEIKLKLKSSNIVKLEDEFKTSLLNLLEVNNNLPSLSIMIKVVHEAATNFNHGLKLQDVYDLYDAYLDEGGSIMNFYSDVYMEIYRVSGFFTNSMINNMEENLANIDDLK